MQSNLHLLFFINKSYLVYATCNYIYTFVTEVSLFESSLDFPLCSLRCNLENKLMVQSN